MSGVWNVILGGDTVLGVFGSALFYAAHEHMAKLDPSGAQLRMVQVTGERPSVGCTLPKSFKSWGDVLKHVADGGKLLYKAPLDYRAQTVFVVRVFKNGKIRVNPGCGADPFTMDAGHMDRLLGYEVRS